MNLRALFARPQPETRKEDERFPAFAYPRVDIFFWSPRDRLNFGDYLASAVVARMLARREMLADEPVGQPTTLFSIGSVLHFARDGETVWGSGRGPYVQGGAPAVAPPGASGSVPGKIGPPASEAVRFNIALRMVDASGQAVAVSPSIKGVRPVLQ